MRLATKTQTTRLVTDDLLYHAMRGELSGVTDSLKAGANPNVSDGRHGITALSFGAITTELMLAGFQRRNTLAKLFQHCRELELVNGHRV